MTGSKHVLNWLSDNQMLLWLAAGASLVIFLASLFIIPAIVVRIRPDYFAHEKRPPSAWAKSSAPVRVLVLIVKNTLGIVLILAGLVMLGLPGQGLLTMLCGVLLMNFPGKYRFERWLISLRPIRRPVNWLRRRAGHEPLMLDPVCYARAVGCRASAGTVARHPSNE